MCARATDQSKAKCSVSQSRTPALFVALGRSPRYRNVSRTPGAGVRGGSIGVGGVGGVGGGVEEVVVVVRFLSSIEVSSPLWGDGVAECPALGM